MNFTQGKRDDFEREKEASGGTAMQKRQRRGPTGNTCEGSRWF